MIPKQLIAIRKVEAAMRDLKNAGLAVAGLEDKLITFERKELSRNYSIAEIFSDLDYVIIKCPYVDGAN